MKLFRSAPICALPDSVGHTIVDSENWFICHEAIQWLSHGHPPGGNFRLVISTDSGVKGARTVQLLRPLPNFPAIIRWNPSRSSSLIARGGREGRVILRALAKELTTSPLNPAITGRPKNFYAWLEPV